MMVSEIKEIQQQLSILRAEMKTLVDELDQVKDLREQDAYAHSQECGAYEAELSTLRAENERLRERCEAAESMIAHAKEGYFECVPLKRPSFRNKDGKWYAYWPGPCSLLDGDSNPIAFDDWYSAYQACIAAGWLPDSNNKES